MTKNDEVKRLKEFAATLPKRSYLADLFKHLVPQFESDIRGDIQTLPELHVIHGQVMDEQKRLDAVRAEVRAANDRLTVLRNEESNLKHRVDSARLDCRRLADILNRA